VTHSNTSPAPVRLSTGYKVTWGVAALGTSPAHLLSGLPGPDRTVDRNRFNDLCDLERYQ